MRAIAWKLVACPLWSNCTPVNLLEVQATDAIVSAAEVCFARKKADPIKLHEQEGSRIGGTPGDTRKSVRWDRAPCPLALDIWAQRVNQTEGLKDIWEAVKAELTRIHIDLLAPSNGASKRAASQWDNYSVVTLGRLRTCTGASNDLFVS